MNTSEKYSIALPLPQVNECFEKDIAFANALNTSRLGELQTISEYIYQSIILEKKYPDISKTLEGIAIVEMKHYKILSQLMYALGVDPQTNNRIRTLPLGILDKNEETVLCKVRKTLLQNISEENSAKEEYRKLAKCSHDPKIAKILERIADDEELHSEIFSKLSSKL